MKQQLERLLTSLRLAQGRSFVWAKKHWIVSTLAVLIGSCAFAIRDRTVTWEEEVPLNTGEVN